MDRLTTDYDDDYIYDPLGKLDDYEATGLNPDEIDTLIGLLRDSVALMRSALYANHKDNTKAKATIAAIEDIMDGDTP